MLLLAEGFMSAHSGHCGSCAFFDEHHVNGGASSKDDGLCRFNPPISQPGPDTHGLWPVVAEQDWCGHYAPEHAAGAVAAE